MHVQCSMVWYAHIGVRIDVTTHAMGLAGAEAVSLAAVSDDVAYCLH